jgi:hypothetical protein
MRILSNALIVLFLFIISCTQKTIEKDNLKKNNSIWDSWISNNDPLYEVNGVKITGEQKSIDQLLKQQKFENDSIYEVYRKSFSSNYYFVLKLTPKVNDIAASIKIDPEQIKEKSKLILCDDTLIVREISILQDFGASKSKQLLLVFRKVSKDEKCKMQLNAGGIFNKFDHFEFKFDALN